MQTPTVKKDAEMVTQVSLRPSRSPSVRSTARPAPGPAEIPTVALSSSRVRKVTPPAARFASAPAAFRLSADSSVQRWFQQDELRIGVLIALNILEAFERISLPEEDVETIG